MACYIKYYIQRSGRGRGWPTYSKVGDILYKICPSHFSNFREEEKILSDTSCGISQTLPYILNVLPVLKYIYRQNLGLSLGSVGSDFVMNVPNFGIGGLPLPPTPRLLNIKVIKCSKPTS